MKKATNLTLGTKVKEKALAYCKQNEISLSHLVQSLLNEFLDDGPATPVTYEKPRRKSGSAPRNRDS